MKKTVYSEQYYKNDEVRECIRRRRGAMHL